MKRDFPLYEGDGFIRNPAPSESSLLEEAGRTAFAGPFVDFAEIEKRARRTRAEALGRMFARLIDWIDARIRRAKYRELKKYLGESTDLADLERRLRGMGAEQRSHFAQG
jgi:hypothetical protein